MGVCAACTVTQQRPAHPAHAVGADWRWTVSACGDDDFRRRLHYKLADILSFDHALEQMLKAAEKKLGIASPSAVFKQIGQQINRGLLIGLADNRGVINAMREAMDDIAVRATVASFPALAAGGRTAHLYGGQHFYIQQPRRSVLEDIQTLLAP